MGMKEGMWADKGREHLFGLSPWEHSATAVIIMIFSSATWVAPNKASEIFFSFKKASNLKWTPWASLLPLLLAVWAFLIIFFKAGSPPHPQPFLQAIF